MRTSIQGEKSFRCAAPVLWNSFPDEFRTTTYIRKLRARIITDRYKSVLLFGLLLFCVYVVGDLSRRKDETQV